MVSEKELNKMKGTIGDMQMTNHAKTLAYGMKAAQKRRGVPNFSKVDACFGFWFDVCKDHGELLKLFETLTVVAEAVLIATAALSESVDTRRESCTLDHVRI